ncbi:hypothetical protein PSEUBRA_006164 [Kalmanozyma brasiliensis GHG001]|uniref:uncharacterized protein n=1 Tax=Kalmanozyma brasiliensis (strain GHG001) TaxID=1365824 RepID=UPI001CEB1D57|nr:uncharacterized protein PSEUBRA_006164 [Kalmanozyma brasiliensis GHG001]KAF6767635.1 hypothetical protein PSEUBRA_006164 [Kalmanozyma brasiliensis GHG001]
MLSLFYVSACAGLVLASTLTRIKAINELAPHHFVPVWEAFPGRPNPIHQRFEPANSPASGPSTPIQPASPIRAEDAPLQLHPYLFQPVAYPTRMPELAHLYTDSTLPADWTEENQAYTSRYRFSRIESRPLLYRPEPALLEGIGGTIVGDLGSNGVTLKTARTGGARYTEGVFLWPPLHYAENGQLHMPANVLEPRLSDIPNSRIRTKPEAPELYSLDVPVEGQVRRVLATRAQIQSFTTLSRAHRHSSALWLFYESRILHPEEMEPRKTLAFLGAMLLPTQARDVLLATQRFQSYVPGEDDAAVEGLLRLTLGAR